MIDVVEVIRRWQAGQSAREIGRSGVGDRKTVARYVAAAKACGVAKDAALTEEVVRAVVLAVQERPKVTPSEAHQTLQKHRERIAEWLVKKPRPLRLVRILELLKRDGVEVGYTSLRRFAHAELGYGKPRSTVRIDDAPPGEEAQIDFGLMGYLVEEGRRRKLWALIVTLCFSRYMFVHPTFTQTTEDVCAGLDAAWAFFRGVVKRVVPDNASSMIVRADRKFPVLGRSFAEYVQARNFFVDPARVEHPQDKGRVENGVPYVRERWFDGETFHSLDDARAHAVVWCRDTAGGRIHGTTCRVPRDHYEAEEWAHMLPAPDAPFDVPRWTEAIVHADHHLQVARALYSAPTALLHKTVDVRADRSTVRIYFKNELIKIHGRKEPGGRSTDPSHYPVGKADYAMRSVDGIRKRAAGQGVHVGELAERLLGGPLPWTKMRQAYGLVRLCERYGKERVDAVCARALSFDVTDVSRIERMLKTAQLLERDGNETGKVVQLPSRFARDPASFATRKGPTDDDGGAK